MGKKTTTLLGVNKGTTYTIEDVQGNVALAKHLMDMGFVRGEHIYVLSATKSGVSIIIKDTKLALSKDVCKLIVVAEKELEDDMEM